MIASMGYEDATPRLPATRAQASIKVSRVEAVSAPVMLIAPARTSTCNRFLADNRHRNIRPRRDYPASRLAAQLNAGPR